MKTLIYHGGTTTITKPSLIFSSNFNDYGIGFYCTKDLELAREWSCRSGNDGIVNAYYIDMEDLEVLNLSANNENALEWIAILMKNRAFKTDTAFLKDTRSYVIDRFAPETESFDIIQGYRADDSYFQYAEAFVENRLPLRLLSKALKLGKLGYQIALVSQKSLEHLTFHEAEELSNAIYYPKFLNRDSKAREDYKKLINGYKMQRTDVFLYDIIREEMDADDPRIQRSLFK